MFTVNSKQEHGKRMNQEIQSTIVITKQYLTVRLLAPTYNKIQLQSCLRYGKHKRY